MSTVSLQAIGEADLELLYEIYASTREDEMAMTPWSEQQKRDFLRMQFHAQHNYYQEQFGQARFDLIKQADTVIGRLYLDRRADEIRIIDIALLPPFRGRGVGSRLLESILQEAQQSVLPVRIHVEKNNPAMRLYQRLGFELLEDKGIYELMEWRPAEI